MFKRLFKVFTLLGCAGLVMFFATGGVSQSRTPGSESGITGSAAYYGVSMTAKDPLYDLCFTAKRGVAVGYYGTILLSEDGGNKWRQVPSGTKELLTSVSFPDDDHGWAVGSNGVIIASADGGRTWKPQVSGTTNYLLGSYFINAQQGWAVGEFGTILHTQDGGANWQIQPSGETDLLLEGVRFINEKRGFVVGEFGTIMTTADGGATWTNVLERAEEILDISTLAQLRPTLYSLDFMDDKIGVAVGVSGCILRTKDGGKTWDNIPAPTSHHLYRVKFVDGNLYAVGLRGVLLMSADQGQNWRLIALPTKISLSWHYGIAAGTSGEIFLAGEDGEVLKQQVPCTPCKTGGR